MAWDKGLEHWKAVAKQVRAHNARGGGRNGGLKRLKRGCREGRKPGAKDHFVNFKKMVKQWVEEEIENEMVVEPWDMVMHFRWIVMKEIEYLQGKDGATGLRRIAQLQDRLKKLGDKKYAHYYKKELLKYCDLKVNKPSMQTKLTLAEEAERCKST